MGISAKSIFLPCFLLLATPPEIVELNRNGLEKFGNYDFFGAIDSFNSALEGEPGNTIIRINLIISMYNAGAFEEAAQGVADVLAGDPANPYANYVAGLLAIRHTEFDQARQFFGRIAESDPMDSGTLLQLGLIEFNTGNLERASDLFQRSFESDPSNRAALYNLARAQLMTGNTAAGQQTMQQFKAYQKDHPPPVMGGMGIPSMVPGKYAQPRCLSEP